MADTLEGHFHMIRSDDEDTEFMSVTNPAFFSKYPLVRFEKKMAFLVFWYNPSTKIKSATTQEAIRYTLPFEYSLRLATIQNDEYYLGSFLEEVYKWCLKRKITHIARISRTKYGKVRVYGFQPPESVYMHVSFIQKYMPIEKARKLRKLINDRKREV